jgi:hypothetical protein
MVAPLAPSSRNTLAMVGDDDRGQPFARLIQQQDQGIAHQGARRFVPLFEQAHSGHWLVFALILEIAVGEG